MRTFSFTKIAYVCLILILVLLMIFSGLRILESTVFVDQENRETVPSKTIIRNGVSYFPRQDLTVILVMGIDRLGKVEASGSYNNSGAADMVALVIFDEKNKTTNVLCLNRDTILEMPVLGIGGKEAGTIRQQLALSHTYGSGLDDSCLNTCKTVSNFLYGLQIDYYVSMNTDAIAILNDAVGGVEVTVTEDFSEVDPTITKGKLVLTGQQAIHYVRTRKGVGDQSNASRMQRQEAYMNGFLQAFRDQQEGGTQTVLSGYKDALEYMVTDVSVNAMSGILERYGDYTVGEVITPEGEHRLGDRYMEFYADEEALDELILRLFYTPK